MKSDCICTMYSRGASKPSVQTVGTTMRIRTSALRYIVCSTASSSYFLQERRLGVCQRHVFACIFLTLTLYQWKVQGPRKKVRQGHNQCYISQLSLAIPKDTKGRPSSVPICFVTMGGGVNTRETQGMTERQGRRSGSGRAHRAPQPPYQERTRARVVREVVRESRGRVKGRLIYIEPPH